MGLKTAKVPLELFAENRAKLVEGMKVCRMDTVTGRPLRAILRRFRHSGTFILI